MVLLISVYCVARIIGMHIVPGRILYIYIYKRTISNHLVLETTKLITSSPEEILDLQWIVLYGNLSKTKGGRLKCDGWPITPQIVLFYH
jgi:hypothetical protein